MNPRIRKPWTPWRIVIALSATTLVAVAAFIGWQYWLFSGGIFRTASFNEAEWKSLDRGTSDFSCYRGGMAHDIKTNILRIGLAKSEVVALLGKPDTIRDDVHEYDLGMCSGFGIDFDTLDVQFNEQGLLADMRVVQH